MGSKLVIIGLALATFAFYVLINKLIEDRQNAANASRLGCQPPPRLRHRIPFAVDLVYELFSADRKTMVLECLEDWFARAGASTFSYKSLNMTLIFTTDPKNLQAILSTQFQDFSLGTSRRNNFSPFLGHGIFTEDGKEWESSRAILRPHFSRSQISDLRLEEVHVQNLFRALPLDESGWTAQVDLQVLFFRLTLDSATEFLFGKSVNSQNASLGRDAARSSNGSSTDEIQFGNAFDTCSKWVAKRARMNDAYWLLGGKEFRENCKKTHTFVDHLVDNAMSKEPQDTTNENKYSFLDSLLEQTSDRDKIRSEMLNILLAGRDTTAGLLGWLFYILVRHHDVYLKLRSIILEHFGSHEHPKEISLSKLKDCQYLQDCLNETLRLYPPVPLNARQALRDTTLPRGGGPDGMAKVFVRKGQQVDYTVYVLHRRRDLWGPDADEFKPERWIGKRPGWEYLPFSGGPRLCLGQQLALIEISYVTVRLLQRFDRMESRDTEYVTKNNLTLTSSPYPGVDVIMHGTA